MKNTPKQEGGNWSMGSSALGRNYLGYKGQALYVGSCCWYFLCSYFPDGTSFLGWVLSGQRGFLKWIALAQWVGWLQAPALGLTQQSRDCFIDHSGLGSRMRSEWTEFQLLIWCWTPCHMSVSIGFLSWEMGAKGGPEASYCSGVFGGN